MSFGEVAAARRNAFVSACKQCKKGVREPNWLHADHQLQIGIDQWGRVVVKFEVVNETLGALWVTICQMVAKPGTLQDESSVKGDPRITFEVA